MGPKKIYYWDLKDVPQPIVAPGEHLANGLQWTGVVAGCVAISPIVVALLPRILTGVISE